LFENLEELLSVKLPKEMQKCLDFSEGEPLKSLVKMLISYDPPEQEENFSQKRFLINIRNSISGIIEVINNFNIQKIELVDEIFKTLRYNDNM
jgi:hypothetical protein